MLVCWTKSAWKDYLYWQTQDRKTLKKINDLIDDSLRNGTKGAGHPELLKGDLQGFCSKTIDKENRLVFRIRDDKMEIIQCRTHYLNSKKSELE